MPAKVTIGNAELWHADCREVLPMLPKCGLILTDPPYGIGEHGGKRRFGPASAMRGFATHKQYENLDWDNEPPPEDVFRQVIAAGTRCIIWGANHFISRLPVAVLDSPSWLVWHKKGSDKSSFADCELAWTNLGCAARYFRHDWVGFGAINSGEQRLHPAQKPVRVMEWCLSFVPDAKVVCDPFMGSGTTGVACAKGGRHFVGVERERKYFEMACERIEREQRQARLAI